MYFSKPIKQLEYDDIVTFCRAKLKENEVLDYKKDFPNKLEKVLSAFANTYGGIIIIGVGEVDAKPEDNPVGIDYKDGLEEKLWGIIMSNINPPIFPEIQVCPPKNNKTFVIIQISQSVNTPHAIENNTKVYLRSGNISEPERLVNLDEFHWLQRNREESIELRQKLINRSSAKFKNLRSIADTKIVYGELEISCAPVFPSKPTIDLVDLKQSINDLRVNDKHGNTFPSIYNHVESAQGSLILSSFAKRTNKDLNIYTSINNFGVIQRIEGIAHYEQVDNVEQIYLYLSEIIMDYVDILRFYRNLKDKYSFTGDFIIELTLNKIFKTYNISIDYDKIFRDESKKICSEMDYYYKRSVTSTELDDKEQLKKLIVDFAKDIHWSLGFADMVGRCEKWVTEKVAL